MRFQFIEKHRLEHPVRLMCRVLKVSPSGYYAWRGRPVSNRAQEDAELWTAIEKAHDKSYQVYGYRRVYKALVELAIKASHRRIARLMRQYGRRGRQYRRYVVTTKTGKRLAHIPDLVERQFTAERPNQVWVSDITYVRTFQGWLYLAAVLDLYARRIVGWSMKPSLSQELASDALKMALTNRQPAAGLIHHSDRGSQYTSNEYQAILQQHQVRPSFGKIGSCFDNAAMESFFGSLKSEWLYHHRFATRKAAQSSVFHYIELFYNRQRLHSANGYRSPADFESDMSYARVH